MPEAPVDPGCVLSYHEDPAEVGRPTHKYWYAVTNDGNYDAAGSSIETALSNLVRELHRALLTKETR